MAQEPPPALAGRKQFTDGTHRLRDPAETVALLLPHLKAMGITRIADVTGLDRTGIPVVMVCRPNARSVAVSQGKGLTLDAARASGLMEAVETWHAERIAGPLLLGSVGDLEASHPLIEVDSLPAIAGGRTDPHLPIHWIEGRDLGTGAAIWVPFEMVHSRYAASMPHRRMRFPASTNGLASGNDFLEAACHAICELIERDSTSVWHHLPADGRAASQVDTDSVDDVNCRRALEMFAAAGLEVSIWDTTTDVGVPAFFCLVTEDDSAAPGHMGAGAGCHPTRAIALLRALTEAAQTRTTYIAGSRDDLRPDEYRPEAIAAKYRFARRVRSDRPPSRDFRSAPSWEVDSFAADLQWLLARLEAAGCGPVAAVDLSRPNPGHGMAVVRAVIPGLEAPHDDDDYLPGPRARAADGQRQ
ncbi:MAG: YcaO-like family protein [Alphaproteobacteria bacterium]